MKNIIYIFLAGIILSNLSPFQYAALKTDLTAKINKAQITTTDEKLAWIGMFNNLAKDCKGITLKGKIEFGGEFFKGVGLRLNTLLSKDKCSE